MDIYDGLSIDFTDLKFLPREECKKPDTKIWKIAMWGGMNDWKLIQRIQTLSVSLKEYFDSNNWNYARGLNADSEKPDFFPPKVISTNLIERYYTPETASVKNFKPYRNIEKKLFKPPFVLMKQGQHKKQLATSYIDHFSYCTTSSYVFNGDVNSNLKKGLVSILNSKITTYLLFLTSSSWGIEREQVFMNEVLESPALLPLLKDNTLNDIVGLFDGILSNKKSNKISSEFDLANVENRINSIIIDDILSFSINGKTTVNDCLEFSLNLFENKEKSKALLTVPKKQVIEYGETISTELNDFLAGQDLFANAMIYDISRHSPLMMIKLSFAKTQKDVVPSNEFVDEELKKIDQHLWEEKASNIYFRKKLNYKTGGDIYIIRPNQRRFWSQSMALEDASELILEILNGN